MSEGEELVLPATPLTLMLVIQILWLHFGTNLTLILPVIYVFTKICFFLCKIFKHFLYFKAIK